MIFTVCKSSDCYYNLALEECFLRYYNDDVFMLWQNDNTIVIGKNQNTLAEINSEYVKEKGIRVVRRITGGGAVYHDMGNINFTYITRHDGEWKSDFKSFTVPVVNALLKLGVRAEVSGRNDILANGRKISGNAQTVINGRLLHHGTLMFNTNVEVLSHALRPDEDKIKSKGIKSVSSRVGNISEILGRKIDAEELISKIGEEVKELTGASDYVLSKEEIKRAEKLADEKYRTWEWNFGYSPKYTFSKKKRFQYGNVEAFMTVENGKICEARFYGDFFGVRDIKDISNALCGVSHNESEIKKALSGCNLNDYFGGITLDQLLEVLI